MPEKEKTPHPRKLEITDAAVACFLRQGYHQTGVRDIARQAGVSLGNLYNHFKGKEAILAFVAELEGQEIGVFVETLTDPADPKAALGQFILDYAAYAARVENALLGIEILAEALRNPAIADVFAQNRRRLSGAVVRCLSAGMETGVISPDVDPEIAAYMILDTLEGHGLRGLSGKGSPDKDRLSLQRVLLAGICT